MQSYEKIISHPQLWAERGVLSTAISSSDLPVAQLRMAPSFRRTRDIFNNFRILEALAAYPTTVTKREHEDERSVYSKSCRDGNHCRAVMLDWLRRRFLFFLQLNGYSRQYHGNCPCHG
jgi:hypothetical protein